jgi:hypothetical protein
MGGLFGDPWSPGRTVEPDLLRIPPTDPFTAQVWSGGSSPVPSGGHTLMISIEDLPLADPAKPLLRWRMQRDVNFTGTGAGSADAALPAASPCDLLFKKNGAANGTIAYTGTGGVISFTDPSYLDGDLFELYPPVTIDPTLDGLSITFETD